MIAIILAIVVIAIIVGFAAKKAMFHSDGTTKDIVRWTKYVLTCEAATFTCYGLNKTNAVLAGMFLCLSSVLLHSGFFVANVMRDHGTEVQGMGWILVSLYCLGTIGCIAYSVGFGSHVMNRSNSHVLIR